jgi:hypothetical protein
MELFSLLWIKQADEEDDENSRIAVPYCGDCASKFSAVNWIVVQQYTVRKLQLMYDKLKLDWKKN